MWLQCNRVSKGRHEWCARWGSKVKANIGALERVIILLPGKLVVPGVCWYIFISPAALPPEKEREREEKGEREEEGQHRQRQTVRGLFVAPSLLCTAAPPSMWLSVIACSLLCHSRRPNHRSLLSLPLLPSIFSRFLPSPLSLPFT